MRIISSIFILLVLGSAYAVLLRRNLAETFYLAIISVIAILYLCGLSNFRGSLLIGIALILLFTIISAIYLILRISKDKQTLHRIGFTQGILLVSIVTVFSFYAGYNHFWTEWDEFSYWGIAVKHMYLYDAFTTLISDVGPITLPMYFPGSSLLHYFFTRFGNGFIEYPSYISMNILYFSTLLPLIKNIFTREGFIKGSLLAFIFILIPLQLFFFPPYSTLTVDYLIANIFGITIIFYYIYEYEESVYGILMVLASVFLLTILKDAGVIFALVVCGIIAFDILLYKRHLIGVSKRKKSGKLIILMLPLIISLFAFMSWKLHLNANTISSYYSPVGLRDVIDFFTGKIDNIQKDALFYCTYWFVKPFMPLKYSFLSFLAFFVIVATFLSKYRNKYIESQRITSCIVVIIFGALIYGLGTVFTYIFSFYRTYGSINEHLASYTRYISSYIYGMQFFLLIFLIPLDSRPQRQLVQNKKNRNRILHISFLSKGLIWLNSAPIQRIAYNTLYISTLLFLVVTTGPALSNEVLKVRQSYKYAYIPRSVSVIQRWLPYLRDNANTPIYIISQSEQGWRRTRMIDVGELYPYAKARTGDSTIVVDLPDNLPSWPPPPLKLSPKEWEQYVISNNITYLYVDLADDLFIKSYGQYFKSGVENGMLYHINVDNHGKMYISPVELIDNLTR